MNEYKCIICGALLDYIVWKDKYYCDDEDCTMWALELEYVEAATLDKKRLELDFTRRQRDEFEKLASENKAYADKAEEYVLNADTKLWHTENTLDAKRRELDLAEQKVLRAEALQREAEANAEGWERNFNVSYKDMNEKVVKANVKLWEAEREAKLWHDNFNKLLDRGCEETETLERKLEAAEMNLDLTMDKACFEIEVLERKLRKAKKKLKSRPVIVRVIYYDEGEEPV